MHKAFIFTVAFFMAISTVWSADTTDLKKSFSKVKCTYTKITRGGDRKTTKPRILLGPGVSSNWSGYVAADDLTNPSNDSVTGVMGNWVVPAITASGQATYSAIWVGIDGYTDGTVEQIGTEHDWINGAQQNYAWFEMYPNGSYQINGFPVNVGDMIIGQVGYPGANTFEMAIYNMTQKVYAIIPTYYTRSSTANRSCCEWIVEAPSTSSGVLPLANFNEVVFSNCSATIDMNGGMISSGRWPVEAIIMEGSDGELKASPSDLNTSMYGFTVTWEGQ